VCDFVAKGLPKSGKLLVWIQVPLVIEKDSKENGQDTPNFPTTAGPPFALKIGM
jgi:hypothetical protein